MPDSNPDAPAIGLVVAILVLASSTSIMSTDMYTPSLPDLAREFDTTPTRVKLTISLNLLAFGLAQLVHGPLSDRFGRRPVLLGSLSAVAVLCLVCAAANTVDQLIVARILLGLAAAAEAVIGLAILKDLYTEQQQVKALALLGMVIAITPAIAPVLGGYLHVHFGWQSNFYFISVMAVFALLVVALLLPESTTPNPQALKPGNILCGYASLLRNQDFLIHSTMLGVALGLVFVFVTAAPFVLIDMLGVRADRFGYYQLIIVVCFFIGSLVASVLADRWRASVLLNTGAAVLLFGACLVVLVSLSPALLTPMTFACCYGVMTFGMGPFFAVAPSHALRSITGQSGSASALLSGLEQSTAGLAAVSISLLHDGSARPVAITTSGLALLLVFLLWKSRRTSPQSSPAR